MKDHKEIGNCELCNRVKPLTFHHLIPRTCHRNKWFKKNFSTEQMKKSGVMLCDDCHNYIHQAYPEKEMGRRLHTVEALKSDEMIAKFAQWVRKKR